MKIRFLLSKIVRKILPYLPKKIAHSILFFLNHKRIMDWSNPKTYDEKMTWALANLIGENEAIYADKYKVRDYVTSMGLSHLLPTIYGVWEKAEDIDFDALPKQFVLKANHAAGDEYYYICKDSKIINKKEIVNKFSKSLKSSIWKLQCEYHYKYIKPLVFAEEYLNDGRGNRMTDYKIHCFDGEPFCILVCSNRDQELKLDYYDTNWNYLDITPENLRSGNEISKPFGLGEMLKAAKILSSNFPTCRVDFYDINGKVYFGEITLTPAGGNLHYINNKWQKILGEKINYEKCINTFEYKK